VHDPTDIAAQAAQDEQTRQRARIDLQLEISDFKWLMTQKRARRFMWRQLELAGVFQTSFTGDALHMAFNEGQRNTGLRVLAMVHEHAPESYQLMLNEHNDRRNSNG
jgi:hypothetical protein